MTKVLNPNLNHLMCSQSGALHDLSGHSPAPIYGSEQEPDSSTRQEYANHQQSLGSDMGLRYLTIPPADDVRYTTDNSTSQSPVYTIDNSVPNTSTASSLNYWPDNIYHPPINAPSYNTSGSTYFTPPYTQSSMPDIKPRLGPIHSSSGLSSVSRFSGGLPQLSSPTSTRDLYSSSTPHYRRNDLHTRSPPPYYNRSSNIPLSPSTSGGFTSPITTMDSLNSTAVPPLLATEVHYSLQTSDGQIIRPEIFGRIDKGFFLADNDWTCYRRNYFSLNCSYTLQPAIPNGTMYVVSPNGGPGAQVLSFAMCIAAVVDGRDGKPIELVQHTPKRDKGPQEKPSRITLAPRPPAPHGLSGYSTGESRSSLYDANSFSTGGMNGPALEATFERIQFKNATANNGKRRAAQQYYHLLVELFADTGNSNNGLGNGGERWVKIASRMSAPMVVRGRSPGHYQVERRGSNTSSGGQGGSTGGGGGYTPSGSSSRTPGDMSGMSGMGGGSNMMPSYGGYGRDNGSSYRTHSIAPLNIPVEPILSAEEARGIESAPGYLYYPASIYENHDSSRYGSTSDSSTSTGYSGSSVQSSVSSTGNRLTMPNPLRSEYGSGFTLPSLNDTNGGWRRSCGRFEGVESSKGYFPSGMGQHELNIT